MNVRDILIRDNCVVIDNFIDPQQASDLYKQFNEDVKKDPKKFIDIKYSSYHKSPNSIVIEDYHWFLELLVTKTPMISELVNEPMLPTFSYARIYRNGDELIKHYDRPACEIAASIHLGSDGTPYPIFFTKPNGEIVNIELKPGQAVLYQGCRSEHWREKFTGNHYGQLFLCYVRSRGENWDCFFNKKIKY